MEPQYYQELLHLLQRLLEDQVNAREKANQEVIASQVEIQVLREKLKHQEDIVQLKDTIIASKEETIDLLKAAFNRPN